MNEAADIPKRIFISGHRNPDVDSLASAFALAELRRAQNPNTSYEAICPGVMPERAAYLFKRFEATPPTAKTDVHLRMRDMLEPAPVISAGTPLFSAVSQLRKNDVQQLPVVNKNGKYLGMLSSLTLLSQLLNLDKCDGNGLAGRRIFSSLDLISSVLDADVLTSFDPSAEQELDVYVAAMGEESFEAHIPSDGSSLALIVGDRPKIHKLALSHKIRVMIVTGTHAVSPEIIKKASAARLSILQTTLDSASVIRRLKFSVPVEHMNLDSKEAFVLHPEDRLRDFRRRISRASAELFPVVDSTGLLIGVVYKKALSEAPPYRMILVDHNEPDQCLAGVEELPIVEVVDHHRIGMARTTVPIRFTGDVVGSTCTLVAKMFQAAGVPMSRAVAGVLLGGLITDTLMLKSPTATQTDAETCALLEKISAVPAKDLMGELLQIGSALATKSVNAVISEDRKDYVEGHYKFALAQVEETDLELLHHRKAELSAQMQFRIELENLTFFGLLVTDAVHEVSELLIVGNEEVARALPYENVEPSIFSLPGVLSRKKQLLPQIVSVLSALQRD